MSQNLLLHTYLDTRSGYGNDGVGMARAFQRRGLDVHLAPATCSPPLPPDIAQLLCKMPTPPWDTAITHLDPYALRLDQKARQWTRRAVAWTMWEWPEFKAEGSPPLRLQLMNFDLILAYDPVTKTALEGLNVEIPIHMLQGGYEAGDWKFVARDWFAMPFRFIMVGRLHQRKNPFTAIYAFVRLKEEHGSEFNAELHLKTLTMGLHPKLEGLADGIKIHYEIWPQAKLLDFYHSAHCLLAPSAGEGKNLPALEAMSTGIPVICTVRGGHETWYSPAYAYQVDYELRSSGMGPEADPSVEHLASQMWHVYTHRDETRRKGELASRTIPSMCGWDNVVGRFLTLVDPIAGRQVPIPQG